MSTYSQAGVDIDEGDRAVDLMKAHIAKLLVLKLLVASAALLGCLMPAL